MDLDENNFEPNKEYELSFRCVAHLYALFNNDLNDEVSDTTGDDREQKIGN